MDKNRLILSEFKKLIDQIKIQLDISPSSNLHTSNYFRLKQITNAYDIIKAYTKPIKKGNDLASIEGIGKGTIARIDEILKNGFLSEITLNKTSNNDLNYSSLIKELEEIHGIGHQNAYDLVVNHNIKSIKDLKSKHKAGKIKLNNIILTGLKYHNVYKQNIPRSEVTEIKYFLENILQIHCILCN